jgi:hypothetical protein
MRRRCAAGVCRSKRTAGAGCDLPPAGGDAANALRRQLRGGEEGAQRVRPTGARRSERQVSEAFAIGSVRAHSLIRL